MGGAFETFGSAPEKAVELQTNVRFSKMPEVLYRVSSSGVTLFANHLGTLKINIQGAITHPGFAGFHYLSPRKDYRRMKKGEALITSCFVMYWRDGTWLWTVKDLHGVVICRPFAVSIVLD